MLQITKCISNTLYTKAGHILTFMYTKPGNLSFAVLFYMTHENVFIFTTISECEDGTDRQRSSSWKTGAYFSNTVIIMAAYVQVITSIIKCGMKLLIQNG